MVNVFCLAIAAFCEETAHDSKMGFDKIYGQLCVTQAKTK